MAKKFKKLRKISMVILAVLAILFAALIYFSPYGKSDEYPYKLIAVSEEINVSADSVYSYLGKSSNASKWSIFVADIKPLNTDSFPDGAIGSRRKCFGSEDPDTQWDELISEIEVNKKRQLLIYNMQNFGLSASHLATEQRYQKIDENKCILTFTLFYKDYEPTLGEKIKTYFAAYKIKSVFEKNLQNIKAINEGRAIQHSK